MAFMKRIFLFLALNFLVVMSVEIILHVLNVQPYLTAQGLDYNSLMWMCLIWGMTGSLISLALSRVMAKWMMGVKVIDPNTRDESLQAVLQTVYNLAKGAHLSTMPEVGIYDSPELNAFATGPSKKRSLVAISTGLLNRMNQEQIEGVLGHEITHISNGDMVTMTLLQGVVNAFVMFLSRVLAFAIAQAMRGERDDRDRGMSYGMQFLVQIVLEIVFMILGSMVVAAFSRWREFRADQGGARLAGRDNMISALEVLQRTYDTVDTGAQPAVQALKISSRPRGALRFFSSHPPLDVRIARLQAMTSA